MKHDNAGYPPPNRTTEPPPATVAPIEVTFTVNQDLTNPSFAFSPNPLNLQANGSTPANYAVVFRLIAPNVPNAAIVSDNLSQQPPGLSPPNTPVPFESGPRDHVQLLSNNGLTEVMTYCYTVTVTVPSPNGGAPVSFTSQDPEIVLPPPSTGP